MPELQRQGKEDAERNVNKNLFIKSSTKRPVSHQRYLVAVAHNSVPVTVAALLRRTIPNT
jgi:hypothetical protein